MKKLRSSVNVYTRNHLKQQKSRKMLTLLFAGWIGQTSQCSFRGVDSFLNPGGLAVPECEGHKLTPWFE